MKLNGLILMITTLVLNISCGDKEGTCNKIITFANKSESTLYVISSYEYPDTMSLRIQPNPMLNPNFTKVLPKENNLNVLWSRDCIENAFKSSIPSDTLMVYVFDAQILETTPWIEVTENYLVLKRYNLSLENLKTMNWTITYP